MRVPLTYFCGTSARSRGFASQQPRAPAEGVGEAKADTFCELQAVSNVHHKDDTRSLHAVTMQSAEYESKVKDSHPLLIPLHVQELMMLVKDVLVTVVVVGLMW